MLQLDSFDADGGFQPFGSVKPGCASLYHLLLLGAAKTGKKSLAYKYVNGTDLDEHHALPHFSTDNGGRKFALRRSVTTDKGGTANVQLCAATQWPAGERSIHGIMFVFSTLDRQSFDCLPALCKAARRHCHPSAPFVFVENMADRIEQSQLDSKQVEDVAKEYKFRLYRVSAKENYNVDEAFAYLVGKVTARFAEPTDVLQYDMLPSPSSELDLAAADCPFNVSGGGSGADRLDTSTSSTLGHSSPASSQGNDARPLTAKRRRSAGKLAFGGGGGARAAASQMDKCSIM